MKKILSFLILFLFFLIPSNFYSQLDREHWFAPMVDRTGNSSVGATYQTLYLSTNETTPFRVEIYNNNVLIGNLMISKNNPGKYSIPREFIITTSNADTFRPVAKGLYVKGEKPLYASLRFSVFNHGELLTSKGTAGIGTSFFAVMAPITANNSILNFMTSVMATEDNTTVTVTGFNPSVIFSDGTTKSSITFTLNKGQSYIIDGRGNISQNWTGFIGARINADKPVSITNGNFNGQYATSSTSSSDILMDQGVPVDRLGQEFVLMKGNGSPTSAMERALIVATEDNTQIYLNGSTVPAATLNTGAHYLTPTNSYILQGSNHYNMHIRATKNIYVYQLLAGANNSSTEATGGFNYIPPLSCYLPMKIDEIGNINENQYDSNNSSSLTVPTKLNIITEKGATIDVKRNGVSLTLTSANGPFNVTGTNNWVTYSIPNVSGNIAVYSSHAVTAGISAGDDAVGYGGYFAGFSFIPAIIKQSGDCLPGVVLSVTEGFKNYLWLIKDSDGNYQPAPGVNNTNVYEPTQAGIYAVRIQQGSCDEIQTADFKFYNCTTYTNINYETCSPLVITPSFSLSTQALNPVTVKIDTPPTKGTAVVNPDGTITYTANVNATGVDTFKFSFCGDNAIPDCETAQATIQLNQVVGQDAVLSLCTSTGTAVYDLSTADVTPDASAQKVYYRTLAGAQSETASDVITNFTAFSTTGTSVYVKVKNEKGCSNIYKIDLINKPNPVVQENLYTKLHCDDEDGVIDGNYVVNLEDITPVVLANPNDYTVSYYDINNNPITGNYAFTGNTKIIIKVESAEGCVTTKEIELKAGDKLPLTTTELDTNVCDKLLDNTESVNLNDYLSQLSSQSGLTATFYSTMQDALNGQNAIDPIQIIGTGTTTFFAVVKNANYCSNVAQINLTLIKGGQASTTLPDEVTICEGTTTTLDAGTFHIAYNWYNAENPTVVIGTTRTMTLGVGKYFVMLTSPNGCDYKQEFEIKESPIAKLDVNQLNSTYCDDNFDGKIEINFSEDITPVVVTNYDANLYTVTYHSNASMSSASQLPNDWTFTTDTRVYVKITSQYCSDVTGFIDFKIGNKIQLVKTVANTVICDLDYSGSENVNLDDYKSEFLNAIDADATVTYYATLADAQNNINPLPDSVITVSAANSSFFYRFEKAGACPNIGELKIKFTKGFASTTLVPSVTICEDTTTTLDAGTAHVKYEWYNASDPSVIIATNAKVTVGPGKYFVILTSADGCEYKQDVEVIGSPIALLDTTLFNSTFCDLNFDGKIEVNFSANVTPVIVTNYDANLYTVRYYSNAAMTSQLPNNWSYTQDTTVYVKVSSSYCGDITGSIEFKIGDKTPLIANSATVEVCDDDLDGKKLIQNLNSYISLFTTDPTVTAKFYINRNDAINDANNNVTEVEVNQQRTLYIRLMDANNCPSYAELIIKIKTPSKSTVLEDKVICPETTTSLDAGPGFAGYEWYNEDPPNTVIATTQVVTNLSVGKYFVILTAPNGCTYTQKVEIKEAELPTIESILIDGSTVTVNVVGGTKPYQYALDNGPYQSSNVFQNVAPGLHKMYVISADNCAPVVKEFSVIKIYNIITPNNDGYNDTLDFSLLKYKTNVKFQIYDRNGRKVFEGLPKNNYIWDGKINGKVLPTTSYWYVLEWQDFENAPVMKYNGWILLQNRE